MPMYTPTFLSPDGIAINATQINTFSWQVEGTLSQVSFQLFIRRNNDNTLLHDSTKITSATSSYSLPANTLSNSANENKWMVRIWYGAGADDYVDSDWTIFYPLATPTLSMDVDDITTQNYTPTATYAQAQSVPIERFKFVLYGNTGVYFIENLTGQYVEDSGIYLQGELAFETGEVLDTGWIYSDTISYEIVGLLNNFNYEIECHVVNQRGQLVISSKYPFTTTYAVPDDIPELTIDIDNNLGTVTMDWVNIQQRLGIVTGTYEYVTGKFGKGIYLHNGSQLRYFNEPLPLDFTNVFWLKLAADYKGTFIIKGGQFRVGYDGERFFYENNWRITAGQPRELPSDFFKVGIKQNHITIATDTYTEEFI